MKTVFSSNSELIHAWANDPEPTIRKRANSVSCQNGRLYSYNTCIAEIIGGHVIVNAHSYSNSTSKHQSLAHSATHGLTKIYLDFSSYGLDSLIFGQRDFNALAEANTKIANHHLVLASRSRKYADMQMANACRIFENLAAYASLLNLKYSHGDISALQLAAIEGDKQAKALAKRAKENRIAKQAENLEKWRNGENVQDNFEVTALRVNGDEIQTSRGARIPLAEAIKVWPFLRKIATNHETVTPNDMRLGYYKVNRIDDKALTVGCHTIPMLEVFNVARSLNLA